MPHPTPPAIHERDGEYMKESGYFQGDGYMIFGDIDKAREEAYQDGRKSILDELAEDQKKFLEGFAYKPKI